MTPTDFFASLWDHYTTVTPQAQRIQQLFKDHGEEVSSVPKDNRTCPVVLQGVLCGNG